MKVYFWEGSKKVNFRSNQTKYTSGRVKVKYIRRDQRKSILYREE